MRILPYYIIHTFVNSIKKLFKTWVAIFVGVCICFGLIGGVIGIAIGSVVEDSSNSSYEEVIDEDVDEEPLTEKDKNEMLSFIRGAIILITFIVIMLSIYGGDKSGAKIFTMPDVNFLFAAPLPPQTVLMFKTVLQMGIAIASSLYLLFQMPNLIGNMGLSFFTCIAIIIAYAFLLFLSRLAAVFTYTITATREKLRKYIRPIVIAIFLLIVAAVYLKVSNAKGEVFLAAINIFSSDKWEFFPLFGWIAGMVLSATDNNIIEFFVYAFLLIVSSVLLTAIIWRIKADFYEDALSGAVEVQRNIEANQKGEVPKRKKERSKKIRRDGEFKNEGALIFFEKTVYNRRRFARLGIFTSTSITYTLVALFSTAVLKYVFGVENIVVLGLILLVMIFFRNFGNPLASEMEKDFLVLVPEKPQVKLWYCMLGGLYETVLDIFPAVISVVIFLTSSLPFLPIWILLWVTLDFFCSSVGLFVEQILPTSIVPSIKAMFAIFLRMFAIVPGLIMVLIGAFADIPILLILTVLLNTLLGLVLNIISPIFLHSGKK